MRSSLLFSVRPLHRLIGCASGLHIYLAFLRLNGANAKEHPVFKELTRVKQYFEKIRVAENGEQGPNLRVDKAAAGRIVKHALVDSLSDLASLC